MLLFQEIPVILSSYISPSVEKNDIELQFLIGNRSEWYWKIINRSVHHNRNGRQHENSFGTQ